VPLLNTLASNSPFWFGEDSGAGQLSDDEDWGVRRFMLRDPSATIVNVLSHVH